MEKKKPDGYDLKGSKLTPVSSISDSGSTLNRKPDWERFVNEKGNIFCVKYTQKNQDRQRNKNTNDRSNNCDPIYHLSTVKNEDSKELVILVNSLDRYRYGRRSSIIESMLGFGVTPFIDNAECLMVSNVIDDSLSSEYPYIIEGDWFKSLDNIEVRAENIYKLLFQFTKSTAVKLIFKGPLNRITEEKETVLEVNDFDGYVDAWKLAIRRKTPSQAHFTFLTVIVSREFSKDDITNCLFYYPYSSHNFLYKARGSFLTLDSVISNDIRSVLKTGTLTFQSIKHHIIYGNVGSFLVICAFSSRYQSRQAATLNGADFIDFLKFSFSESYSPKKINQLTHACDVLKYDIERKQNQFSLNIKSSMRIALPKEVQLRICDAISELESIDYKKWNVSTKNTRDLIVCGTALYYQKFLLASNLAGNMRNNVECFLRLQGITEFVSSHNVNEMYIWKQVEEVNNQNEHYLAICVRNGLILTVVFKNPLRTKLDLSCISYMEEIAETADYLIACGIESVSEFWVHSNKRPSMKAGSSSLNERGKYKFVQQFSTEYIDQNNSQWEFRKLAQSEEACKNKNDLADNIDWRLLSNKKDFEGKDQPNKYVELLLSEVRKIMPLNLATGWSNELKFFLNLNCVDRTIMRPIESICPLNEMNAMQDCILVIHEKLKMNSNFQDNVSNVNGRTMIVKEHSISINMLNSSGDMEEITIVGRLFSFPIKEVYFCFAKNASQNLVELSFRTSFLNIG